MNRMTLFGGPRVRAAAATLVLAATLWAQPPAPLQQAQFDPSDVFFQGYLAVRAAEDLEKKGDFRGALEKLERANEMFGTIQKFYPQWKPDMVNGRATKTGLAMKDIRPKAEAARDKDRGVVAELEGGARVGAAPVPAPRPADVVIPAPPVQKSIVEVDPLAMKRLREAEVERDRLKKQLAEQTTIARRSEQARLDAEAGKTAEARERERLTQQTELLRRQTEQFRSQTEQLRQQSEQLRQQSDSERLAMQRQLQKEVEKIREEAIAKETKLQQDLERLRTAAEQQPARDPKEKDDVEKRIRDEAARIAMQRQVEQEVNKMRAEAEAKEKQIAEQMNRMRSEALAKEDRLREEQEKQLAEARAKEDSLREEQQKLLAEARAKEDSLRKETEKLRGDAAGKGELAGRNKELEAQLQAAEQQVEAMRSRLAAAPLQSEMDGLNKRIETLEQERRALGTALGKSREEHDQAMARIATLEADLQVTRQKFADLERNLGVERKLSNEVVAGQRRQLAVMEKQLAAKDAELAKANERIAGLVRELGESREAFAELREERDALLVERDQMAALLKLNEAGRVQELIEQNMALARDLRMANEKVERLNKDNNADKDALTDAMRDLAIAKAQINRLQHEKRQQDERLAGLEKKLREEEKALASGQATADPEEVQLLRDIIKRQLRVQERRRQARELLLEAARDLGKQDERLAEAIDLFDAQEIQLTPEEMKMLADKQVDGEFISPFARDRAVVGRAEEAQRSEISAYERAAEKSFLAGRYLSTREVYQTILDERPGHTPSLCRLGVVHLKLEDPAAAADTFQRAVELNEGNPYAHRMLGYSLMMLGDLTQAEQSARRAVDLAPNDASSQMLLATLCYRMGRTGEAESHFKAAITADPMPSEPYYNLGLIYSLAGKKKEAREFYQQALERGALPDAELESRLQ
jgi:Flp pilus assembly protein TadD/predicted  nucleic acid-binding Zn-ribbon protein